MFTDPMLGAKCAAVDQIVNETWQEWEHQSNEPDPYRPPIIVLAHLFMQAIHWLWCAAQRVHVPANAPLSGQDHVQSYLSHESETIPYQAQSRR